MVPRGVRKYDVTEVMRWFGVRRALADSWEYPNEALPWKHVAIVAMHNKNDRRNKPDTLWLTRHVYLHAKHARGVPAVGKEAVSTESVRVRWLANEAPAAIAASSKLSLDEVVDALRFEQKTAKHRSAWTKRKIAAAGAAPVEKDLHGVALVEACIAHVREHKERLAKPSKAKVAGIPASFRAWLAADTSRIECARGGVPKPTSIQDIIGRLGWPKDSIAKTALPGKCYLLDVGDQQATFLFAGKLVDGEWPALTASVEDEAEVWLATPGFDVYIAQRVGYLPEPEMIGLVPKPYVKRMRAQAKANLGGKTSLRLPIARV